jgi:hypothetical protein
MLVIAGIVEGFISPTPIAPQMKFLLAAGLATLLVVYLMSARGLEEVAANA